MIENRGKVFYLQEPFYSDKESGSSPGTAFYYFQTKRDNHIQIYSLDTCEQVACIQAFIEIFCFSPNDKYLYCLEAYMKLKKYDTQKWECLNEQSLDRRVHPQDKTLLLQNRCFFLTSYNSRVILRKQGGSNFYIFTEQDLSLLATYKDLGDDFCLFTPPEESTPPELLANTGKHPVPEPEESPE